MMVASVFGPLLLIIGIWMLFYCDNMAKVCTSCKNTPACQYMWGVMNMLFGLVVINMYNMWGWNLAALVSLLGWVMLIRGVLALFAPHMLMKMGTKDKGWCKVKGIIPLVWGFGLCWLAFWTQTQY